MTLRIIFLALLVLLVSGCRTTPGDAASRSGHLEQAADLYRRGAEQGDADAALKLGLLIDGVSDGRKDFGSAGSWFVKACGLGNVVGCHNAGVKFEYGQSGLDKNYEQARVYYSLAAKRGYMQSQYNLGSLYANGYFTDEVEGLKWLFAAQTNARNCLPQALCKWILEDPPGHVAKLIAGMSPEQVKSAASQAAALAGK